MMVDYKKAKELALSCWSEVDYCTEHEDAFVFSKFGDLSIGGNSPVVVLKETGRCIIFIAYLTEMGSTPIVREGYIKDFG